MKKAMTILFLAAGIFAAKSQAAYTYSYEIHGSSCHSTTPGVMGEASQYGLGNNSSTQALVVVCPITVPQQRYIEGYISLSGFDRHGTDNLSCTMNFSSEDGYGLVSAKSSTSGSDLSKVKYGNGVRVSPTAANDILWVSCRIPPTYNSGWMSMLTSVYMTLSY